MAQISDAQNEHEIAAARGLFREYASELAIDLCFQAFDQELASLPGNYAAPRGCLLLAWDETRLAGCGALRPLDDCRSEMKRLYVRPAFRGRGIGRMLAERLITLAREAGYRSVYLDTLASMPAASQLYKSLGFVETEPYYQNPLDGVSYLKLELGDG